MKTSEQIKIIVEDLYKIQHGAWPSDYVEAVLNDADSALKEYQLLLTYIERMSSREKRILKSMFNRLYGSNVL